ncbi:MAG: S-adenosylmethionine decarboxylase [Promethearchaeota archaeon]
MRKFYGAGIRVRLVVFSTNHFQLILKVEGCPNTKMTNRQFVETLIRDVASLSEMEILHGPVVVEGKEHNPGLTGFAIIDYSHIAVHTFPNAMELFLDLWSCKFFDVEKIEDYIQQSLNVDTAQIRSTRLNFD